MIIEGTIINHDSSRHGQIEINPETGLIEAVASQLGSPDLKPAGLIFPGFVDVHVHAREDQSGRENYKEDFRTVSQAAINGGVVAIADMPNNPVPPVDEESFRAKQAVTDKADVDVVLYAGIGPDTGPLQHPVPYKVYMAKSVGEIFFKSLSELKQVMGRYTGQSVSFHCEDPDILKQDSSRPPEAETRAIEFALKLMKKYKLAGKICHLSTKEGLQLIRQAKTEGAEVTCEVTPHHLYFDQQNFQMNPPLRAREDRVALLEALKKGEIDYLASDHAPHLPQEKQQGAPGLPQLDTYGAFVTWLLKEQDLAPEMVARVCAFNPGKFINNFTADKFGLIAEGYVGSLTILDPDQPFLVGKGTLKTKCGWSPFQGMTFPGQVTHTLIRGRVYVR